MVAAGYNDKTAIFQEPTLYESSLFRSLSATAWFLHSLSKTDTATQFAQIVEKKMKIT